MAAPDRVAAFALAALAAACASAPYAPCPVGCEQPLPADAFARCRQTLERSYGGLADCDEAGFRLQTVWASVADPPGERRATVFRAEDDGDLAIVVELRWLTVPLFGLPTWTGPRADAAAERELAAMLRAALAAERP